MLGTHPKKEQFQYRIDKRAQVHFQSNQSSFQEDPYCESLWKKSFSKDCEPVTYPEIEQQPCRVDEETL